MPILSHKLCQLADNMAAATVERGSIFKHDKTLTIHSRISLMVLEITCLKVEHIHEKIIVQ